MFFILTACCNFILLIYSTVHCRTGSLENLEALCDEKLAVHCRTGSLEILRDINASIKAVHCRTGSLESC